MGDFVDHGDRDLLHQFRLVLADLQERFPEDRDGVGQ